jgi:ribonuclease-3 family protein
MEIREYNATSLAYIGDAVMSLYVRELLLSKGYQKPKILQQESVRYVSAKAQASFVKTLKEQDFFHEEEWAVIMRGRNTHTKSKAKNADMIEYRYATGLEALFGYLYLSQNQERLNELWEQIKRLGETL